MGDSDEGKPAQTNALAALFFARLYGATGNQAHRDAALSTIGWLDAALFDPERNLYRWSVRYERPDAKAGRPGQEPALLQLRPGHRDRGAARRGEARRQPGPDRPRAGDRRRDAHGVLEPRSRRLQPGGRRRAGLHLVRRLDQPGAPGAVRPGRPGQAGSRWPRRTRRRSRAAPPSRTAATRCATTPAWTGAAPGCGDGRARWAADHTRDTAAQAWAQHLQAALARSIALKR